MCRMRKILIALAIVTFFPSLGVCYQRVIVQHQRELSSTPCVFGNIKLEELWSGYSLLSLSAHNGNVGAAQDLAKAGSCVEQFHPTLTYNCNSKECNYAGSQSKSSFLVKKDIGTKQTLEYNAANENTIKNMVSRCSVCAGNYFVIVKHSYQNTEARCDSGYEPLWKGYSFTLTMDRIRAESSQSLSDTGSCLPSFVPHPALDCNADNNKFTCSYSNGKRGSLWLAHLGNSAKVGSNDLYPDRNNTSNYRRNEAPYQANIPRISRCTVCVKKIL